MPRIQGVLFTFLLALAWSACDTPSSPVKSDGFPLHKLEGKWEDVNRDNAFFEEWTLSGDNHLKGKGYVMSQLDTVFIEVLEIVAVNDDLIYRVGLSSKQNDELVEFKMTRNLPNEIVFENPEHDFPKKISYEIQDDSNIFVHLNGHEAGKFTEIHFAFVRGQ